MVNGAEYVDAIRANDPRDAGFDRAASFFGRLFDDATLDWDAYWRLEQALFKVAEGERSHEVSAVVFSVFAEITRLFHAHANPADVFRIDNASDDDLHDVDERLRHLCHCYFEGARPSLSGFPLVNPLLA